MITTWYIIVNPISGNGKALKKWPQIENELLAHNIDFIYVITEYHKHAIELVQQGLKQGYSTFICVGGDGTLHQAVNGILLSGFKNLSAIKLGIIPIGTGNDWIKNYNIPKHYKKAIKVLIKGKTVFQDIGKIIMPEKTIYFNNVAGIGFDGFVVKKIKKYKYLGVVAYLAAALAGISKYKRIDLSIEINNEIINSKSLLVTIGICKYSGGGMQLTDSPNSSDGLFDITYVSKISFLDLLIHLPKIFNGKLASLNFIKTYKSNFINITCTDSEYGLIQADGESIGYGNIKATILPKQLQFIVFT